MIEWDGPWSYLAEVEKQIEEEANRERGRDIEPDDEAILVMTTVLTKVRFVCQKCGKDRLTTPEFYKVHYVGQTKCLVCREWELPRPRKITR